MPFSSVLEFEYSTASLSAESRFVYHPQRDSEDRLSTRQMTNGKFSLTRRRGLVIPALIVGVLLVISLYNIHESGKSLRESNCLCKKNSSGTLSATYPTRRPPVTVGDLPRDELSARRSWELQAQDNFSLDLGVPIRGGDKKLVDFAKAYGEAIKEFRAKIKTPRPVNFRLLLTRFASDDTSSNFRQSLAKAGKLDPQDIVFLRVAESDFRRADAINLLHTHTRGGEQTVLAITDVHSWVGARFLYNALRKVNSQTIYFPVTFAEYRPSTVLLVEQFMGPQSRYSNQRGLWLGIFLGRLEGVDDLNIVLTCRFAGFYS